MVEVFCVLFPKRSLSVLFLLDLIHVAFLLERTLAGGRTFYVVIFNMIYVIRQFTNLGVVYLLLLYLGFTAVTLVRN